MIYNCTVHVFIMSRFSACCPAVTLLYSATTFSLKVDSSLLMALRRKQQNRICQYFVGVCAVRYHFKNGLNSMISECRAI